MEKWISLIILTCVVYNSDCKTYRIAWMAPGVDSGQEINSYTSVAALKLALESVAVNPMILDGHNIEVKYFSTDCSPHVTMQAAMDAKRYYNPDVFIGPPCQDGMRTVAQLCTFWDLPVFTWYNPGIEFDGTTTYPTLIRMIPSLNIMGHSLVHLMRQNNWDQFVLVYDFSNPWSLYEDAIRTEVEKTHIHMWGSHDVNSTMTNEDIRQLFIRIKQHARIVVFACPNKDIRRYMIIAESAGMADGNFVFIQLDHQVHSDDDLSSVILSDKRWKKGDLDDGPARQAYQSLVHVLLDPMYDDETPTYALPRNRYNEFARMAAGKINKTNPGWDLPPGGQSDAYSLYLYDTVLIWSVLLDKLRTAGISERNGTMMAREASLLVADGATGFISLNDENDRIGKIFIMSLDKSGAFKPTEILKFNSTNGYDAIRIKAMHDRVVRLFGARTIKTPTVDTVKVVPVQPVAPEHPDPIAVGNVQHETSFPVEVSHVQHTSEQSQPVLTVEAELQVPLEPVIASHSVDTQVAVKIPVKTPTTKRPRPPRPPVLNPVDSKPPRPPVLIPSATPSPVTTKSPSDQMIEKLMLRLQALEKQIKDHESHAHQHIPDHTHTPHPLLKRLTTIVPFHSHSDHAHGQLPPVPTLHHSQTVTDHPHHWHLHHDHPTDPTPHSQSQNIHSKGHAHMSHSSSQAHGTHLNSNSQNANSKGNSVNSNSINHAHSNSNSQNAQANMHVHSSSQVHKMNSNIHAQNTNANSHAHDAHSQNNHGQHAQAHLTQHAHVPTTMRTVTSPTTLPPSPTTVLPVTTPIVTPAVTQAMVQENGQINDQILDRISSRLVDQLLGVPASPQQNNQQTTNTSAAQTQKEQTITNDWLANNLDEIGPGLVFLRIARDQQIRNAEAERRYQQALHQRQLLQQQLLLRQQQQQQTQQTVQQQPVHSEVINVENPVSSQENWLPYHDPLATIFDPIMGIWDPMIPPPTTYPRPW